MKNIILKYTNEDWETVFFRLEGNIMFSTCCTAYNVFVKFCDSLPDFKIIEKVEIPVEFEIENFDYGYLLNGRNIEDELAVIAQQEMETLVEEYLVSDEIAFDLNDAAYRIAPLLEKRCVECQKTDTDNETDKEKQKLEAYRFHLQKVVENTTPLSAEEHDGTNNQYDHL